MIEPWLRHRLPEGGRLALDVGANVGTWATWLAGRFLEVHAFEPHPDAYQALAAHTDVHALQMAVGDTDGNLTLNLYGQSVHSSVFGDAELDTASRGDATAAIEVAAHTIDGLGYHEEPVDFIKVDVEGYEAHVLRGAERTLAAARPTLIVEVHAETAGSECLQILDRHGYRVERIAHPHSGVHPGHHWLHATPEEVPDGE